MVMGISVPLNKGKKVKGLLKIKRVYEDVYLPIKKADRIIFPIRKNIPSIESEIKKITTNFTIQDFEFRENTRTRSFRRELQKIIPQKLYDKVSRSYEQIGDIGIISVFPKVEKYEQKIARALKDTNKGIRLILKKTSKYSGKVRVQSYEVLDGKGNTETIHKESRVNIKLDVKKVYFSARTANERKRIASQVKTGEKIMVLFSGCAPFPLVIAKNSKAKSIWGIELNPEANRYGLDNIKLNKLNNIKLIQGDVREVIPTINEKFDRIIIPHPTEGDYYLEDAITLAEKNCIIHLYHFSKPEKLDYVKSKIMKIAKRKRFVIKKIDVVEQMHISSEVTKFCFDIHIKKK